MYDQSGARQLTSGSPNISLAQGRPTVRVINVVKMTVKNIKLCIVVRIIGDGEGREQ